MITLVRTCYACPEQYNALDKEGKTVGYLRLRHGTFTVECPDVGGELVYVEKIDELTGIFSDEEREKYLEQAVKAIGHHMGYSSVTYRVVDEWDDD
jgi:hypothetical protein